jgi:hypothetical protein
VLLAISGAGYATRASSHEERLRLTLDALEQLRGGQVDQVAARLADFDRQQTRRLGAVDTSGG